MAELQEGTPKAKEMVSRILGGLIFGFSLVFLVLPALGRQATLGVALMFVGSALVFLYGRSNP
ncbi:hypothetical protein IIA15_09295 [candidate division TA06 bacterium]|nr:hypothetical protein [candidate division TA06 bacterium]